jgi:hypothetical protein
MLCYAMLCYAVTHRPHKPRRTLISYVVQACTGTLKATRDYGASKIARTLRECVHSLMIIHDTSITHPPAPLANDSVLSRSATRFNRALPTPRVAAHRAHTLPVRRGAHRTVVRRPYITSGVPESRTADMFAIARRHVSTTLLTLLAFMKLRHARVLPGTLMTSRHCSMYKHTSLTRSSSRAGHARPSGARAASFYSSAFSGAAVYASVW